MIINILIILIIFNNFKKIQDKTKYMNQQIHSSRLGHEEQAENWEQKYKAVLQRLTNFQHEHKKIDIEIRNDLEFERKRANQFEQKYKNTIKYQNSQQELKKILSQLNQTLTHKQNQILQYIKADQQKKRKITQLDNLNQQLSKANDQIRLELNQIQQGAISALLEKDNIIQDLQQKIISFQNIDTHGLETTIVQLQQKYRQLEDRSQAQKRQAESIIDMKDEQIREIRQKFQIQRQRYQQKINLLDQQIISYEKHIDKINQERYHEQNLQQKYYILQEKQRKTQKKLQDFQMAYKTQKQDLIEAIQKLQNELSLKNEQTQQLKNVNNKFKQLERQLKNKKKQIEDNKHTYQKSKSQFLKKITQLEQEKKKVSDNLQIKTNQLQRLRIQAEQNLRASKNAQKKQQKQQKQNKQIKQDKQEKIQKQQKGVQKYFTSLTSDLQTLPLKNSSRRQSQVENVAMVEKLRTQIKQLQTQIQDLNSKLEQEMKQVQRLRQNLVSKSGSAGRSSGQAKLLVQIQDLNSYIKKVQHNLMITKLKYAEDESHWSMKESGLKKQIIKIETKSKKQKAELIERIDRMKKVNVKDKKTDYYQSSLR